MQRRTRHDRHPNIDALMRPVTRRQSALLPKREGKRGGASVPESRPLVAAHDLTLLFLSPIPTHEPSRPARSAYITCRSGESSLSRHSCARPTDSNRRRFRAPNTLHNRASLGLHDYHTPPSSGRSSPYQGGDANPFGHRFADDLEGQNDEHLEGLTAKVKLLKDVSESCTRRRTVKRSTATETFS